MARERLHRLRQHLTLVAPERRERPSTSTCGSAAAAAASSGGVIKHTYTHSSQSHRHAQKHGFVTAAADKHPVHAQIAIESGRQADEAFSLSLSFCQERS